LYLFRINRQWATVNGQWSMVNGEYVKLKLSIHLMHALPFTIHHSHSYCFSNVSSISTTIFFPPAFVSAP
jgi:hypothetical protein